MKKFEPLLLIGFGGCSISEAALTAPRSRLTTTRRAGYAAPLRATSAALAGRREDPGSYPPGVAIFMWRLPARAGHLMGVGDDRFRPLLANPPAARQRSSIRTVLGALTLNYFGIISFTLRRRRPSASSAPTARRRFSGKLAPELLGPSRWRPTLYGAGAADPAADHEGADHG
nr:hypothetical protein [Klebsiella pneumoniae]